MQTHPLLLLPSFEPPTGTQQIHTGQILTPFDHGLSNADLSAIRMALTSEMNPNHLIGFASTLSADHPVSASLLYARSALLEQRPRGNRDALIHDANHAAERLRELIDRVTRRQWSGANALQWISETPIDAGKNLAALVNMETSGAWRETCHGLEHICRAKAQRWPRLDRLLTAADGAASYAQTTSPQSASRLGELGRLSYECALALAQPVPLTAKHQYPTAAALQAFGFHEMYPRTRGQNVLARATDFAHAVATADRLGTLPWVTLLLQRRTELDALVYGKAMTFNDSERELRRAASDLVVDPQADLSNLPAEVALLARALVIEIGPDLRVIDPAAARMALRPLPLEPRSPDRQRWLTNYFKSGVLERQAEQGNHA